MLFTKFRFSFLLIAGILLQGCTKVAPSTEVQQIFLVRHAEKVQDDSRNPPLTPQGTTRANNLANLLSDQNIAAVFSSPYLRTQMTAQPTATQFKLEVMEYDPHAPTQVMEWITQHPKQNILIVGHSNTTPALINQILGKTEVATLSEDDYGKLFIINGPKDNRQLTIETF